MTEPLPVIEAAADVKSERLRSTTRDVRVDDHAQLWIDPRLERELEEEEET